MCVFSAANEVAVAAFLAREIRFTEIDVVIASALEAVNLFGTTESRCGPSAG